MSTNYNAYMVQAYTSLDPMPITEPEQWGIAEEHDNLQAALAHAEELSEIHGGAVVYSVVADLQSGITSLWKVVQKFGQLPPDQDLAV